MELEFEPRWSNPRNHALNQIFANNIFEVLRGREIRTSIIRKRNKLNVMLSWFSISLRAMMKIFFISVFVETLPQIILSIFRKHNLTSPMALFLRCSRSQFQHSEYQWWLPLRTENWAKYTLTIDHIPEMSSFKKSLIPTYFLGMWLFSQLDRKKNKKLW